MLEKVDSIADPIAQPNIDENPRGVVLDKVTELRAMIRVVPVVGGKKHLDERVVDLNLDEQVG